MLQLFRMDLYRLFHRKMLYVLILALSAITCSMLFLSDPGTMTLSGILGVMDGVSMDNFMSAGSGLGLGYTFVCILLAFFVCDDFSSGFAKNIFTVHANKRDYIGSKILSMMVAGAILMLVSLIESVAFALISGIALDAIGGIVLFWIGKWIVCAAFSSAILFVSILFRNKGLGFLVACLLGTGGLVMGIEWALQSLQVPFAEQILSWTMYGASTIPTLHTSILQMLQVIAVSLIWTIFYALLSAHLLRKKDI